MTATNKTVRLLLDDNGLTLNAGDWLIPGWIDDPEHLIGKSVDQILTPAAGQEPISELIRKAAGTSKTVAEINLAGQATPYTLTLTPISIPEGQVIYSLSILPKPTSSDLEVEEIFHQVMFQNLRDAVYVETLTGELVEVNEAACSMLGYTREEMLKLNVTDLIPEEEQEDIPRVIAELEKYGSLEAEALNLHRDGSVLNVEISLSRFQVRKNKYVIAVVRDVTASHTRDMENRLLRRALDSSDDPLFITNALGELVYANFMMLKMTGYHWDELIGKSVLKLAAEEQDDDIWKQISTLGESRDAWRAGVWFRTQNGGHIKMDLHISPVVNEDGVISHFIGTGRDRSLEEDLQKRLLQAQKLESLGLMAGGIAHDFNNILAVFQDYSSLYLNQRHTFDEEKLDEVFREIHQAGKRGREMTHQLLTFASKRQGEHKPLDPNQRIRELNSMFEQLLQGNLQLKTELHSSHWILGDPVQLDQVLINLVKNAGDASGDHGVVTIRTENTFWKPAGSEIETAGLRIQVKDNGEGIPEDVIDKIFDPFFTTKSQGKGTGLGLAIVYGIIKDHHGDIQVHSERGQGTRIDIRLRGVGPLPAHKEPEAPVSRRPLHGRILLVDDDALVRKSLGMNLISFGFEVFSFSNCKDAANFLMLANPVDLLILDVVMPRIDGINCLKVLHGVVPDIPYLFISGFVPRGNSQLLSSIPQAHLLYKPVDRQELYQTISKVLARQ